MSTGTAESSSNVSRKAKSSTVNAKKTIRKDVLPRKTSVLVPVFSSFRPMNREATQ